MSVSPRFLQELRDRLTLSDVIGGRIKLTRAGREFRGCCPFHREKTPSFHVNDDKQFFHCFGCGAHGDALGFVMRHDNLSFIEAVEQLASKVGMQVPQSTPQDVAQSKKDKGLHALCEEAAQWFEEQLHNSRNREVLAYVKGRGFGDEVIDAFRLGYAPSDDQALRNHLSKVGYSDAQMIEAGVIKASTRGTAPYAFFRDRVIFPVMDARGRVVAFGGRVLPEHMRPPSRSDFTPPKYINSADTPLFHKGRTLYAGQHARLAANDHDVLVVEGYMDVIACQQAGFKGAVAPLGTALTEEQIMILWKMIPHDNKEPILCFDGDEAGYRAAVRAADRILPLLKSSHSVKIAFLPEGDDPDTFIRENGSEAFRQLLKRSAPLVEFLWAHNTAGQIFVTPEQRAGLSTKLENLALTIPDAQLQYHYKQAFREKLNKLFGFGWSKAGKLPSSVKGRGSLQIKLPPVGQRQAETMIPRLLLLTAINHPEIYPYIHEDCHRLDMGEQDLRVLQDAYIDILENHAGAMEVSIDAEIAPDLDKTTLLSQITARGLTEICDRLIKNERLYVHAGFARPDVAPEKVLEGWKSLMSRWEKTMFSADLNAAKQMLTRSMTVEDEGRMLALKQMQMEQAEESD
ncbi:MAG: DNA primase [Pseudobdellovibrionaceae bacterium]|jgi:DNA primase|nr:DNA primase [Pseudobdellovibrionaceae bacterium]